MVVNWCMGSPQSLLNSMLKLRLSNLRIIFQICPLPFACTTYGMLWARMGDISIYLAHQTHIQDLIRIQVAWHTWFQCSKRVVSGQFLLCRWPMYRHCPHIRTNRSFHGIRAWLRGAIASCTPSSYVASYGSLVRQRKNANLLIALTYIIAYWGFSCLHCQDKAGHLILQMPRQSWPLDFPKRILVFALPGQSGPLDFPKIDRGATAHFGKSNGSLCLGNANTKIHLGKPSGPLCHGNTSTKIQIQNTFWFPSTQLYISDFKLRTPNVQDLKSNAHLSCVFSHHACFRKMPLSNSNATQNQHCPLYYLAGFRAVSILISQHSHFKLQFFNFQFEISSFRIPQFGTLGNQVARFALTTQAPTSLCWEIMWPAFVLAVQANETLTNVSRR